MRPFVDVSPHKQIFQQVFYIFRLSSEKDAMEREMDALKIRLRAKVAELKQKKDSIWYVKPHHKEFLI